MTGKPAWTPGPWRTYKNEGRWIIATTTPWAYSAVGLLPRNEPEIEAANAALIAAAPDLAQALKPFAFCDERQPPYGVELEDWQGAVNTARAALARARGEQP